MSVHVNVLMSKIMRMPIKVVRTRRTPTVEPCNGSTIPFSKDGTRVNIFVRK